MAAPSYTTDLQTVNLAEAVTGWAELSGHTGGSAPGADGETYIQGSYSISQSTGSKTGTNCGMQYDYGSDLGSGWTSGDCFFFWQMFLVATAVDTWANGGLRVGVGSTSGNMNFWKTGGNDVGRYPYGGWQNFAIDPEYTPVDYVDGTPAAGVYQIFGSLPNILSAITKGDPHCVDAIRYGRGEVIIEFGDLGNGYGTFVGIAAKNDANDAGAGYNRWGLFSAQAGVYLWKGLLSFGNVTNACDFRDSNRVIVVADTPRTSLAFNKIEINNAGSRVDWTTISFVATGTLSPGRFEATANADINLDGCSFTGMDTFIFGGTNSSAINCIWQGCKAITGAGGTFTGSKVLGSSVTAGASAFNWNVATDPDGYLDDMTFVKGANAHHAIELGLNSPLTMTFRGLTSSGFNAADGQDDSFFHVKRTTGDVTINIIGGTGDFKYKSDGANVNIVVSPVTTEITVKNAAGVVIENAQVLVEAADDAGDLPFEDVVTITRVGTVATVAHTGHGLANGAKVVIRDADQQPYNKVAVISNVSANAYDYTVSGTPDTPATGTIKSSGVVVAGLTNAQGIVSASRSFTGDQNVKGTARKMSASPYYKERDFTDVVDQAYGLTKTVQLTLDE